MKKFIFKVISVILVISFAFILCSCSIIPPKYCTKHIGKKECTICGLNYFDELSSTIKNRATSVEDGEYEFEASTDTVDCIIDYVSDEDTVHIILLFKTDDNMIFAVFLLSMKSTTGTIYGWALSSNDKMANGTFKAEDVSDLVFRPDIDNNQFTEEEFSSLNYFYEYSISFCLDVLHAILSDNKNNLKISDLGFVNYSPSV